ncbi:ABC transporter substrate-binding protein [Clostridium taeniosporum]|uniref:Amino acid ABC transporter substrate-binding protein n=1 Tax=Clostridium taeniosporum TaxID=394958 RepID=A0A1D7XHK6_9CLOT|nr:ABC transporter substrate-binding protein [Clostridium taeniosporum]AOR22806.1 amino acid ABC transporter substrate-binding protein [Clostridium taeniosporum]
MRINFKKILILVLLFVNCIGCSKVCNAEITNNLTSSNIENKDRIEKIKEKGVLTILTSDLAPFAFIDPKTNEPTGIDIDILKEIAKELGVDEIEMKVVPFVDLLEQLNIDDSIDVAASGIIITEKRKELVDFTDPLYKESEAIIVPKVSLINFEEDLKDAVVGAQNGSIYMDLAEKWKKEGKVKDVIIFESVPEILSAISEKKIDAGIMDSIIGEYLLFKENLYLKILEPYKPQLPGKIGIAVRKSDVNLLNEINKKIDDMKKDKTIIKILRKYGLSDDYLADNITKLS